MLANAKPTEHQTLVEVCKRVPHGVVCLLSALPFHRLTTQIPHEVWLAIGSKTWPPKLEYPPLRIVRFSPAGFSTSARYGQQSHEGLFRSVDARRAIRV